MVILRALFVHLLLLVCTEATYGPFSIELDPRAKLTWQIDGEGRYITIDLSVFTKGWVGFGFSTTETMLDSDVYVGFVLGGTDVIHDYWISSKQVVCPGICRDSDQGGVDNVLEAKVTQENGVTTMHFKRLLRTEDETDVEVVSGLFQFICNRKG